MGSDTPDLNTDLGEIKSLIRDDLHKLVAHYVQANSTNELISIEIVKQIARRRNSWGKKKFYY